MAARMLGGINTTHGVEGVYFEWLKSGARIIYDKGFTPEFYKEMGNIFISHFDKYVPWDSKNKSGRHLATMVQSRPTKEGATIVYSMRYAKDRYQGLNGNGEPVKNPDLSVHPLSTSYWDKECWTQEHEQILGELTELRRKHAKK